MGDTRMGNSRGAEAADAGGVTVLVSDRHDATRLGLGLLLQRQTWVTRCVLAADRDAAVALTARHRPRVAVVDVSDVGPFAATVTAALTAAHPSMNIVLSSRCASTPGAPVAALGAVAFLGPGAEAGEILSTLRAAAWGAVTALPEAEPEGERLTDRERSVLALLSTGATNREIAAELCLGPDTVKKCATTIYRKLGVRNRTEATRRAPALLA